MSQFPIVDTASGRVRGVNVDGIARFLGIPYGAPSGGSGRFLPPRPALSWAGVRNAYGYGAIAPQSFIGPGHPFGLLIDWDLQPGDISEDCLNLNVWTPGADGQRRPVLVYFHGGGHSQGSGNHALYTGDRLARFGDVVVVTVNHRLGALGYFNLVDAGAPEQYAGAGNCGTLDLVQSLTWIRDNIAAFGGDPDNVTLFGQSGGGRKISVLMSLDRARGLFHKAFIQSGSSVIHPTREEAGAMANRLLAELGTDWRGLLEASMEVIVDAQSAIGNTVGAAVEFRPYVDGEVMTREPFYPDAPGASADIPLVIGYCLHDLSWKYSDFDLNEAELRSFVGTLAGSENIDRILDEYREEYPDLDRFLLRAAIATDHDLLYRALTQADRRAEAGGASTWVYRFDWASPAFDSRYGATHGLDMGLVFHNFHQPTAGGDRPEVRILANRMASMLVALARSGSPETPALPAWPSYTVAARETLIVDLPDAYMASDPNARFRRLWDELR